MAYSRDEDEIVCACGRVWERAVVPTPVWREVEE